jgi:uncharacterized protein
MELTNEFRVNVPVDEAWAVLTDVERIAPCMPGAQLQEVEGDEYRGVVKVKVGPITAQYRGSATFVERDAAARRAVLEASGRDTRGQGNASATVTATLAAEGSVTVVTVATDLTVTGKVAQFGRGVLADVSSKLITQFVECLERDVLAAGGVAPDGGPATAIDALPSATTAAADEVEGGEPVAPADGPGTGAAGAAASPAAAPAGTGATGAAPSGASPVATSVDGPRRIDARDVAPVDLVGTAGSSVAKRVVPLVGVLVVVLWLLRRRRR